MRRRLFERLQQRIEAVVRQHVHLVDEIHLEASTTGCVLHILEQFAGIFYLGAGRGVDFDQVDETTFADLAAGAALATRGRSNAGFAIKAAGEDTCDGGLADSTGTGEQVGVVQALVVECIDQRLQHMALPHQFAESARTPFACQNLITHRGKVCGIKD